MKCLSRKGKSCPFAAHSQEASAILTVILLIGGCFFLLIKTIQILCKISKALDLYIDEHSYRKQNRCPCSNVHRLYPEDEEEFDF